jgi:hypothetical protein
MTGGTAKSRPRIAALCLSQTRLAGRALQRTANSYLKILQISHCTSLTSLKWNSEKYDLELPHDAPDLTIHQIRSRSKA